MMGYHLKFEGMFYFLHTTQCMNTKINTIISNLNHLKLTNCKFWATNTKYTQQNPSCVIHKKILMMILKYWYHDFKTYIYFVTGYIILAIPFFTVYIIYRLPGCSAKAPGNWSRGWKCMFCYISICHVWFSYPHS